MIVSKEHLVRTMNNAYGTVPFLPVTYDLSHLDQLRNFIADFSRREKDKSLRGVDGEGGSEEGRTADNIWIMKRYRGRQSMDYPISDSLSCALRHLESSPRLACKYVTPPALFKGRKFDLRFYVIVLSLQPLRIFRHEMFVIRAANTQYSASDLEEYQKHFTVMNFLDDNSTSGDDPVRAIRGAGGRENPTSVQFIANFNKEHSEKLCGSVIMGAAQSSVESCSDNAHSSNSNSSSSNNNNSSSSTLEDKWGRDVQPAIDSVLRKVFEGVDTAFGDEPPHPSGKTLHPNAGGSRTLNDRLFRPVPVLFDCVLSQNAVQLSAL
jgi:Tubulin-tyrosine ligase family